MSNLDFSSNKNLFMLFLTIRFAVSLVAGISVTSSNPTTQNIYFYGSILFAISFMVSLVLTYKNNRLGAFLFSIIAIIELLLNIDNITNIDYIPSLLFWRVFGIYLAYKTYIEIKDSTSRER